MTGPDNLRRHAADGMAGVAVFSPCGTYRYLLQRTWNPAAPTLVLVMLNPSTADATTLDATLRVCLRRAVDGGFGRLQVLNLFAFRATHPADLLKAEDPVGAANDAALADALADRRAGDHLVCAWGNAGDHRGRGHQVARQLRAANVPLHHLGLTAGGAPRHPLYVALRQPLLPWREP